MHQRKTKTWLGGTNVTRPATSNSKTQGNFFEHYHKGENVPKVLHTSTSKYVLHNGLGGQIILLTFFQVFCFFA